MIAYVSQIMFLVIQQYPQINYRQIKENRLETEEKQSARRGGVSSEARVLL